MTPSTRTAIPSGPDAATGHIGIIELNWPWWLHPAVVAVFLTGGTVTTAIFMNDDVYATWGVPKYLDETHSSLLIIGLLALIVGMLIPTLRVLSGGPSIVHLSPTRIGFLKKTYRVLLMLTILGYLFWAISAASQGVSLSDLASVMDREDRALGDLKANSRPIAGLTTFTQLGPLAAALGALLHRIGAQGRSFVWLLPLAMIRTLFYAERLALLEVLTPVLIVLTITAYKKSRWTWLIRLGPLVAAPIVWSVFAASEYMRSWVYYQNVVSVPFIEWVTTRMLGYYVTAYNNSALFSETAPGSSVPPYFSVPGFWNAPGVELVLPHPGFGGIAPEAWWASSLKLFANPEFTNIGSFLVVQGELGTLGMIAYWLFMGIFLGMVYVSIRRGSLPMSLAYCTIYVGILELPRFIYWVQGRFFPIIIAICIVAAFYPRDSAQTIRIKNRLP